AAVIDCIVSRRISPGLSTLATSISAIAALVIVITFVTIIYAGSVFTRIVRSSLELIASAIASSMSSIASVKKSFVRLLPFSMRAVLTLRCINESGNGSMVAEKLPVVWKTAAKLD
ncbi:MAG: hypothetical protein RR574_01410, partial [Comamonas sp.]